MGDGNKLDLDFMDCFFENPPFGEMDSLVVPNLIRNLKSGASFTLLMYAPVTSASWVRKLRQMESFEGGFFFLGGTVSKLCRGTECRERNNAKYQKVTGFYIFNT